MDGSDLSVFAGVLGLCSTSPSYIACADYNPSGGSPSCPSVVDGSDFSRFAVHLGHVASELAPKALLLGDPDGGGDSGPWVHFISAEDGPGSIRTRIVLEDAWDLSSLGIAFRWSENPRGGLVWSPAGALGSAPQLMSRKTDDGGEERVLLLTGLDTSHEGRLEVGSLRSTGTVDTGSKLLGFELTYGEATRSDGTVVKVRGAEEAGVREQAFVTKLLQSAPNPMLRSGAGTVIRFELETEAPVRLEIFDLAGRLVQTLLERTESEGVHSVRWDGADRAGRPVSDGLYFYRLTAAGREFTRKIAVLP